jgi:23S rRNA (guanosine2251-2'-O)-methyltransferase
MEALLGRRKHTRLLLVESVRVDRRIAEILRLVIKMGIAVERVDRETMSRILPEVNHQGVALQTSSYPYEQIEAAVAKPGPLLVLDHLVDPQNVGTLLRTAEAFGVSGVLIPRNRAAAISPAVVNSSAGAVEHLAIAQVTNLAIEIDRLKEDGWWVSGFENHESAHSLQGAEIPQPAVIIIGSEGTGISQNLTRRCDLLLRIGMSGKVNSLNAAVAGSIALYEISRCQ